ncbi:MAG: glycosyltransferase family 2 protein [Acidimicrobiales bacterium]
MTQPDRAEGGRVAAVVVDYDAGPVLAECVRSLREDGVGRVVVVENGSAATAEAALGTAAHRVPLMVTGRNIGYGAGANRGVAASGTTELVLVCNPDLRLHPGATRCLVAALDARPEWAIVGPRILNTAGAVYPSVRRFPSMVDAAGHALLALAWPDNPFTRRYRPAAGGGGEPRAADWVSGACFLARRAVLEELGGFDEGYFMFAEDMDLCWRAHRAGWSVGVEPRAVVTHAEGVSRRRHPYRMLVAHHRSALRFAARTATSWRRLSLLPAALVLGIRLVLAFADQLLRRRHER